jgi:hypothetical protein
MSDQNRLLARSVLAMIAALSLSTSGCVGLLAHIGWVTGGDLHPAEYDGLEAKKVAVIVVSNGSTYGPGSEATLLGTGVERLLKMEVTDIEIINQDRIADWIDQNNWNELNYIEAGKGLGADMVIGIDIENYRLTDGQTMFKGRADYSVKVYDMSKKGDKVVWSKQPPMYEFPKHGGRYRDTTSKHKFQRQYNSMLSQRIARYFHPYPIMSDYATDAMYLD